MSEMNEDSMPSKRMVPVQQLSDAGEDLVRLAAAKDAEFAAYREKFEDLLEAWGITTTLPQEQALEILDGTIERAESDCANAEVVAYEARQELAKAKAKIATLTEQRDELIAERNSFRNGWTQAHNRAVALTRERDTLTEQRDRAMKAVVAARRFEATITGEGQHRYGQHTARKVLKNALAALDAEAAAETAPSLPETPKA